VVAGDDERGGEGRAGDLVIPRLRIYWREWRGRAALACVALLLPVLALAGCATGAPTVASNPTPTPLPTDTPTPTATATATPTPTVAVESPAPATPEESTDEASEESQESAASTPRRRATRTPTVGPTPRPSPPEPDGSGLSQIYERGTSGRPEVALTFDAGSDRGKAEQILDTLAEYGVKASFGITGQWAADNQDLVARMAEEGHMIFNHSWSHRSFTGFSTAGFDEGVLSPEERYKEIEDTEQVIREATGGYDTTPYFRPPYGDIDDSVLADLADAGYYITVMWSCDSLGWNGASVEEILSLCVENAQPGDIILMHVGSESLDAEALPAMIEMLQEQGLELVTVEELLQP